MIKHRSMDRYSNSLSVESVEKFIITWQTEFKNERNEEEPSSSLDVEKVHVRLNSIRNRLEGIVNDSKVSYFNQVLTDSSDIECHPVNDKQQSVSVAYANFYVKEQIAARALKDSLILAPLSLSDGQISSQLKAGSSSTSTTGSTIETQIYSPDSGKEKDALLSGKEKAKKDHGNDVNRYTMISSNFVTETFFRVRYKLKLFYRRKAMNLIIVLLNTALLISNIKEEFSPPIVRLPSDALSSGSGP